MFGAWLRAQRSQRGMTLAQAGRCTGFSAQFWSDMETGRRSPSRRFCQALAQWTGIPRSVIDLRAGFVPQSTQGVIALANDEEIEGAWIRLLSDLTYQSVSRGIAEPVL